MVSIEPRHCRGTLPGETQGDRLCWRFRWGGTGPVPQGYVCRNGVHADSAIGARKIDRNLFVKKIFSTHVPDTKGGFAFFEPMIDPETWEYLSEDFAFCRLCRATGIDVWLDTKGKLGHTGTCNYE